jgi:hypothetical protein
MMVFDFEGLDFQFSVGAYPLLPLDGLSEMSFNSGLCKLCPNNVQ